MSIRIEIFGDSAEQALADFRELASAIMGPKASVGNAVSALQGRSAIAESKMIETAEPVTSPSVSVEAVDTGSPDVDAHGWPWSAELHASTKGTTKDGLWRMKIGVTRPAPKPGFPIAESTSTPSNGAASAPTASVSVETAPSPAATSDDDEFAAFRAAAAKSDAQDAAAQASVPARKWTDADLGALCNQAAVKLGDPSPVKETIAKFIPEGVVAHSRNIPEDQRQAFADAIEAKAGIEFAG